ncbi:hypothetical protein BGZ60DRAFT_398609 [Tricladium varicosporioides]|nr:hypothetical protein BGZ60DRAFT_398609 [Hymenoscyphus varicosporioides]
MAGQQRTFDLVPTTLIKSDGPKRAMTSKQAKKAYLKANNGPRVSKAEQRRQEAKELARQKYEWEKEKAAAKAKAVRDKKVAKAAAERQARKKAGLPEPSKHVRASQGRISHFIRAGNKRTWQEMEEVVEDSDATVEGGGIPPKGGSLLEESIRNELESEDEFGDFPSLSQTDILEKLDSSAILIQQAVIAADPTQEGQKFLNDEFVDFSSLSQLDFSNIRAETKDKPRESVPAKVQPTNLPSKNPPQQPPILNVDDDDDEFLIDDLEMFADMAATQLLLEAASVDTRTNITINKPTVNRRPTTPQLQNLPMLGGRKTINSQENWGNTELMPLTGSALSERSINMPPPPLPFKCKTIGSFAPSPDKSRRPRNNTKSISRTPSNLSPSSTQAFLENNLDDFFPSSSQEARELTDDFPSNTQVTRELGLDKPYRSHGFEGLCCTQDLISSQGLAEICTLSRSPTKEDKQKRPAAQASKTRQTNNASAVLASDEYHDRTTARPLQLLPEPAERKPALTPVTHACPRRRAPFFEEKEEDNISHQPATRAMKEKPTPANPTLHQRKGRFFEEKYEDVLHAVLQESKKEEALRIASEAAVRLPAVEPIPKTTKRTLQRVQSGVTDYGDDDFHFSSQELLALP